MIRWLKARQILSPPRRLDRSTAGRQRSPEIDGIRGWASVSVLFFHVFWESMGEVVPALHNPFTNVVMNGHYPVLIFFILSGDALSSAFFHTGDRRVIDRLAVKRYLRLTLPVLMSCVMVWLLMVLHLDFHREAAVVLQRVDRLGEFLQMDTSLTTLLRYALYGVYAEHTMTHSFNPMLWTMSIEWTGSIMVFIGCYLWSTFRVSPWPVLLVLALALLKFNSIFCLFAWGMLLSLMRSRGIFDALRRRREVQLLSSVLLVAIAAWTGTQWNSEVRPPVLMAACAAIVPLIYMNDALCGVFSNRLSVFLGRLSFPLYLTHFSVMISLMSWLVIHPELSRGVDPSVRYLLIASATTAVSFVVAMAFLRVETPLLAAIDRSLRTRLLKTAPTSPIA